MLLHSFFDKIQTRNIIVKTEQTIIVYAQWDRWTSYDVRKHDNHWCYIKIALKAKRNLLCYEWFINRCVKSFLNKLYTPKVMVPNIPKRNVFVKLPFLLHPLESEAFSPSRKSYLRCCFRDLFTSISVWWYYLLW